MDRSIHSWQSTRVLPDDSGQETDPSWSPDGRKMIFSTGEVEGRESQLGILDLTSHQISTLPGSDRKFGPRWSADGQFASSLDAPSSMSSI